MLTTYADLMDHVLLYSGDDATRSGTARHRTAVQRAYQNVVNRHQWTYLWALGRVTTNGPVGTSSDASTVAYTASTRTVTLTGATWPSWAADGYLVIANVPYEVDDLLTSTTLRLEAAQAPAANIASGTSYALQRDQYPLPADLVSLDEVVVNEVGAVLTYMHPRNWTSERRTNTGPGQPWMFTVVGDRDRLGRLKMTFWPPPDGVYNMDFPYRRKPRALVYDRGNAGLASISAAGTTVTGTNTLWSSAMVGSVIRLGADNQTEPTGEGGNAPASYEGRITAVASATSLTVDTAATDALSGVRVVVTDPVDIDWGVMGDYLLREIEKQFRSVSRMTSAKGLNEDADHALALVRAMEDDNRPTGRAAALRHQSRRSGFIHYPIQFTG